MYSYYCYKSQNEGSRLPAIMSRYSTCHECISALQETWGTAPNTNFKPEPASTRKLPKSCLQDKTSPRTLLMSPLSIARRRYSTHSSKFGAQYLLNCFGKPCMGNEPQALSEFIWSLRLWQGQDDAKARPLEFRPPSPDPGPNPFESHQSCAHLPKLQILNPEP